jgi:hypothetical protein
MGRRAPDRAESLPRVLAGLLVPIVGIGLLTFYLSDRPAEAAVTARSPVARTDPGAESPAAPGPSAAVVTPAVAIPETPGSAAEPAATEAPAAEPEPAPEPTVTPDNLDQGRVNADDGLNIRSGPSTNFGVVRVAPFGELLELTGETTPEGDLVWVELVDEGWVQDQYLDFE